MAEYISREAVKEMFKGIPLFETTANMMVDCIPAADVVEVRRGFWEYVGLGGALWCSECKKQSSHMGYATNKFCPNCGAIMDKNKTDKVKIQ